MSQAMKEFVGATFHLFSFLFFFSCNSSLISCADHISRVVADLEPVLVAELEKMEQIESEAGGLPVACVIEASHTNKRNRPFLFSWFSSFLQGSAGGSVSAAAGEQDDGPGISGAGTASGEPANKHGAAAPGSGSNARSAARKKFVCYFLVLNLWWLQPLKTRSRKEKRERSTKKKTRR